MVTILSPLAEDAASYQCLHVAHCGLGFNFAQKKIVLEVDDLVGVEKIALLFHNSTHQTGNIKLAYITRDPLEGASLEFVLRSAFLVMIIFGLMSAYCQAHEWIQERTGLRLTHVCCIVYATLSIAIDLSIKNGAEAYGGSFPFNPACCVVVVEFAKLAVSLVLFAMHAVDLRRSGGGVITPGRSDIAWLLVPAGIYAINNLIVFQAIKSIPLSTFGVVRETMLVWSALLWSTTFGVRISATRWLAIGGIIFGCCANQIPKMLNDEFTPNVFWAMLLAFSNAAGAVANEYAMKQRAKVDINLQNCIVYTFCGSFVLIGIAICEPESTASWGSFFYGFVPECWQVIILQVFTGLAVSRILKYVEAVTKTIVAAIRGPGVIFVGVFMFHTAIGRSEVLATLVVCFSCWIYLRQGPLVMPAAPDSDLQRSDKTIRNQNAAF